MGKLSPLNSAVIPLTRVAIIQSWWIDAIFDGVALYARQHHWLLDSGMRLDHELPDIKFWNGQGIIAFVGENYPNKAAIRFIEESGVPVVNLGKYFSHFAGPKIYASDEDRGEMAAAHLLSLGFHEFAFISMGHSIYEAPRKDGFASAIRAAGGTCRHLHLNELPKELPHLPRPLGIFTSHDLCSIKVLELCLEQGYRVPQDIAVVGCDDTTFLCESAVVPLTSVNCNHEKVGYEAAALLHRLMLGEPASEQITIRPKGVTVRSSTDIRILPNPDASRFLTYLREHFAEKIHFPDVCRKIGVSQRTVQSCFKDHLGITPAQELARIRLQRAKLQLVASKDKVESIAIANGFERSNFVRVFTRSTGMSPSMYRIRSRNNT